jgi:hypothetical protein
VDRYCADCGRLMEPMVPRKKTASGLKVCPGCFPKQSFLVVGHDSSGNPTRVNHCPMCGSGQLSGGPSGIECVMCHKSFTVQLQPEFHGMPQTQDGLVTPFPRDQQQRMDDYANGIQPDPNFYPRDTTPAPENQKPEVIVETAARYITANGVAVPYDSFLKHLAISFADNREAVLAEIRASNKKDR